MYFLNKVSRLRPHSHPLQRTFYAILHTSSFYFKTSTYRYVNFSMSTLLSFLYFFLSFYVEIIVLFPLIYFRHFAHGRACLSRLSSCTFPDSLPTIFCLSCRNWFRIFLGYLLCRDQYTLSSYSIIHSCNSVQIKICPQLPNFLGYFQLKLQ